MFKGGQWLDIVAGKSLGDKVPVGIATTAVLLDKRCRTLAARRKPSGIFVSGTA